MSKFTHDQLVVLIRRINPRVEKHGEEDKLAVDVSIWIAPGEGGDQWNEVLAMLGIAGGNEDASEWVAEQSQVLRELPFSAIFEDHSCSFWVGSTKLAKLTHAKLNQFTMQFATEKHDDRIIFRIQAETDGESVGALSEMIGTRVRLEVVGPDQQTLDLEETEDETEAEPA